MNKDNDFFGNTYEDTIPFRIMLFFLSLWLMMFIGLFYGMVWFLVFALLVMPSIWLLRPIVFLNKLMESKK